MNAYLHVKLISLAPNAFFAIIAKFVKKECVFYVMIEVFFLKVTVMYVKSIKDSE